VCSFLRLVKPIEDVFPHIKRFKKVVVKCALILSNVICCVVSSKEPNVKTYFGLVFDHALEMEVYTILRSMPPNFSISSCIQLVSVTDAQMHAERKLHFSLHLYIFIPIKHYFLI